MARSPGFHDTASRLVALARIGAAFRLAYPAIYALVGMNDEDVLALVEAVDGADFDAIGVFASDTSFGHDISHAVILDDRQR